MNTQPHIRLEQRRRAKQTRSNPFSKRKKAVARQGWIESLTAARHSEAPESYNESRQFRLLANDSAGSPSLPPPESSFSSCSPSVENSSPASTSAKVESIRLYRRHAPRSGPEAQHPSNPRFIPFSAPTAVPRKKQRRPVSKIDVST